MPGTIGHLLWMAFGAVILQAVRWIVGFFAKIFGFGFKEAIVASMEKGRPLTKEESAELKIKIREKLQKKLEKDLAQEEEEKIL